MSLLNVEATQREENCYRFLPVDINFKPRFQAFKRLFSAIEKNENENLIEFKKSKD